ncbi:unnamed protein product, partial [Choristocarpus tenellus]
AHPDETLCCVCQDRPRSVVLLPCRHLCLCSTCADEAGAEPLRDCPLCRAVIDERLNIFP